MAHATAAVLATLLVVLLVVVQPLRGRRRYLRLVEQLKTDASARRRFYVRGIISAWVAVGIVGVIGILAGRHPSAIRLTVNHLPHDARFLIVLYVAIAACALAGSLIAIWRSGAAMIDRVRRQIAGFKEILPRTPPERRVFVLVALTAGICEEVLYRGFGIAYLRWVDPEASTALTVALVGGAFGLAHLYQGKRGVALTAAIGAYFTWLTLLTGTLLPAIVIHALVDLRVAALPPSVAAPGVSEGTEAGLR